MYLIEMLRRGPLSEGLFPCFLLLLCSFPSAAQVWPIRHTHDHVQGLEVSEQWFWISAVDRRAKTGWVWRVDRRTLKTVAERDITQGSLYHPGGMQVSGGRLWVPLAEYRAHSRARILELDALTLAERRSFAVDDHIGALATDGKSILLGANWDGRRIYRWNMGGSLLAVVDNPQLWSIQDMKWAGETIFAGGEGLGIQKGHCLLQQLDPETLKVLRASRLSASPCYTREGLAIYGGRFFFLPEDEPNSRIYLMEAPR